MAGLSTESLRKMALLCPERNNDVRATRPGES